MTHNQQTFLILYYEKNTDSMIDHQTECERQPKGHLNTDQVYRGSKGAKKPHDSLS